jgi:hypothetical protein
MQMRRRVKHTTSLEDRIAERVDVIRAQAERERLERRLRQADVFSHLKEWISSPGLRPPE